MSSGRRSSVSKRRKAGRVDETGSLRSWSKLALMRSAQLAAQQAIKLAAQLAARLLTSSNFSDQLMAEPTAKLAAQLASFAALSFAALRILRPSRLPSFFPGRT